MVQAIGFIKDPKVIKERGSLLDQFSKNNLLLKVKDGYRFELKNKGTETLKVFAGTEETVTVFDIPKHITENSLHKGLLFKMACALPLVQSGEGNTIHRCDGKFGRMFEPDEVYRKNGHTVSITDLCVTELTVFKTGEFKIAKLKISHLFLNEDEKCEGKFPAISIKRIPLPQYDGQFIKGERAKFVNNFSHEHGRYRYVLDHAFQDFEKGTFRPYISLQKPEFFG